ncbi:BTAD domain-containing putative transcriptional regulator [Nonomuraea sp. NPDC050310]|uniref:AfsR/SARP family transcriptional regulator n=1 Tax=Nonomuraea sp. NPDC050310 TaxID=3154935 RepID=UPI0033E4DD14
MININLLGHVEASVGSQTVRLKCEGSSIVLCAVSLSPGSLVTRQALHEALWGEHPPDSRKQLLEYFVHQLNVSLKFANEAFLVEERQGYRLLPTAASTDVQQFRRYRQFARHLAADGRLDQASGVYAKAMALHRGTPFGGAGQGWLRAASAGVMHMIRCTRVEATRLTTASASFR